jgi:hypothetical protein
LHLHFDLDAQDALAKKNVTDSVVNIISSRLTRVNHEPVGKLHRLGTRRAEFSRHNNLTALSTRLHDKPKHAITRAAAESVSRVRLEDVPYSPTNGKATKKLVPQAFTLSNRREAACLHLLGIELKGVLRKFESFLNEGRKLANTATFLAEDFLSMGSTNDNLQTWA